MERLFALADLVGIEKPNEKIFQYALDRAGVSASRTAAFSAGGVHLVAVPVNYSENKRVLVDELRSRIPAVNSDFSLKD